MSNVSVLKTPTYDALVQLEKWIKDSPENSRIFDVTPKMAQHVIDTYNVGNRPKKPAKIAEYADDMTDREWKLTGDTLKFTTTPSLGDGQNRLFACIKANKSFRTHIVFGLDPAIFPWLDRGKPRSGADSLAIADVVRPNDVARTVRWLELIRQGRVKQRDQFSPSQILAAYHTYDAEKITEAVRYGVMIHKSNAMPISTAAALFYVMAKKNGALAVEFFNAWAAEKTTLSPVKKADAAIKKMVKASPTSRLHEVARAAVWVTAWNFLVDKKAGTVAAFLWKLSNDFPAIKG